MPLSRTHAGVPSTFPLAVNSFRLAEYSFFDNRYGALDPSALLQALKRLLRRAAERTHLADPPLDGAALSRATTHWLRHTFANNAVDDQVEPIVLRDALGHADLGTTSIYLKPEQKALVAQMAKMRRRG